jgi:hypothetical protein
MLLALELSPNLIFGHRPGSSAPPPIVALLDNFYIFPAAKGKQFSKWIALSRR